MNSQTPTPVTNNTRTAYSDSFQNGTDINDVGYISFYVIKLGTVGITASVNNGFYYVLDMTDNFKPINNQNSPNNYCDTSHYYACYVFP